MATIREALKPLFFKVSQPEPIQGEILPPPPPVQSQPTITSNASAGGRIMEINHWDWQQVQKTKAAIEQTAIPESALIKGLSRNYAALPIQGEFTNVAQDMLEGKEENENAFMYFGVSTHEVEEQQHLLPATMATALNLKENWYLQGDNRVITTNSAERHVDITIVSKKKGEIPIEAPKESSTDLTSGGWFRLDTPLELPSKN